MEETILKVDRKGKLKIPRDLRENIRIRKQARAKIRNRAVLIKSSVDLLEKLGKEVKFSFTSVEDALPLLRKASEKQLIKEVSGKSP